jgi:hypothetical protein
MTIRGRIEVTVEAPSGVITLADLDTAKDDFVDALKTAGFTVGGTINAHDTSIDNSATSETFGEFGDEVTV